MRKYKRKLAKLAELAESALLLETYSNTTRGKKTRSQPTQDDQRFIASLVLLARAPALVLVPLKECVNNFILNLRGNTTILVISIGLKVNVIILILSHTFSNFL